MPARISFAHMGTSAIAIELLLRELGHDVVSPCQPTERTLSLGTQHSPEFACIPFKIVLGTYLEVLAKGADILVSGGGLGPCRAGYYGLMHQKILRPLGYDPEIIFFWPPLKAKMDFIRKIKRLKGNNSWRQVWHAVRLTLSMIDALDDVEKLSHRARPRAVNPNDVTRAFRAGLDLLRTASTFGAIAEARAEAIAGLEAVPLSDDPQPLRVGIVGEIYVQLEPFANFHVEQFLGERGVETHRSIFLSHYTRHEIFRTGDPTTAELAAPYLPQKIGGHGQNSIGDVVRYAHEGYDGVIQLAPFTCIPEIVAKSIIPHLSRELNIPVLTMFIDEQTGAAGAETRLEAFVDLLRQRRLRGPAVGAAHV